MREKRLAINISIIVSVLSFIFSVTLSFAKTDAASFLQSVTFGILGSSLATLAVFISEYLSEKRKAITMLCNVVSDILHNADQIVRIPTDENNKPNGDYLQRCWHGFIKHMATLYVEMGQMKRPLVECYHQLSFFCDFPVKDWIASHRFKRTTSHRVTRLDRERAKMRFLPYDYAGKRKQTIYSMIVRPLLDYLDKVQQHSLNDIKYYLLGDENQKAEVIQSLISLQNELFVVNADGSVYKTTLLKEIREQNTMLSGTVIGIKLFWLESKQGETDNE